MAADEYKRNRIYAAATSSQAARQINIIPEYKPDDSRKIGVYEKPLTVEETFTAKEVREMRMAKRANAVCIAATFAVVLLGITAIIRFSSIFEISKQTRLLNKETAAVSETIIDDKTKLESSLNEIDADAVALDLGLQKPQKYQTVNVTITPSDMTVIHKTNESVAAGEGVWYNNLSESVSRFFGKIDFAAQK